MGIVVKKTEPQTKLQTRINDELREKIQKQSPDDDVDLVDDSAYVKGLKKSSMFSWVWFVFIILAVISLIVIFMF